MKSTILTACLICVAGSVFADAPSSPQKKDESKGQSSLDKQLNDSLDDDLLKDLPVLPKKTSAPKTEPGTSKTSGEKPGSDQNKRSPSGLDAQLLDQLGDGEDIGKTKVDDPIRRIGQRMKQVEQLIQRRDTSADTQDLQKKIAADLETLIKQMQQAQSGKADSSGKPGSNQQASDQSGAGTNKPSTRPASESTERIDRSVTSSDETLKLRQLVKEVWGHLPARIREQMQNVSEEQFLPQYENLIEAYYRRLAEQGSVDGSSSSSGK